MFKQRRKKEKLVSYGVVFDRAHPNFDPLGLTYSMFPLIQMWWLFHVHKAMKRLSHTGVEMKMFFLWSGELSPSIDRPIDLADWRRPSVVCIRVVLLYSKRNWMICQCVCFILRYPFFIWVQWDHVETMCDSKRMEIDWGDIKERRYSVKMCYWNKVVHLDWE